MRSMLSILKHFMMSFVCHHDFWGHILNNSRSRDNSAVKGTYVKPRHVIPCWKQFH